MVIERRKRASATQAAQRKKQRAISRITKQHPERIQECLNASRLPFQDECLDWTGVVSNLGYGIVSWEGRTYPAPRLVLELHLKRPLKDGLETLHSCNNRRCINPWHLSENSHKANMEQAARDGRMKGWKGARKNRALTAEQVNRARHSMFVEGRNPAAVAKEFGVANSVVYQIKTGRTYRDIPYEPVVDQEPIEDDCHN